MLGPAHLRAAVAVLALASVAGCSTHAPTADPAPAFTAPAWFAQQAQQREQVRNTLQTCLDGKGWHLTVDEFGGAAEGFTDESDLDRYHADMLACRQAAGLPVDHAAPTPAEAEQAYQGQLDTAACLRANGAEVTEPPSRASWVDAYIAAFVGEAGSSAAGADDTSVAAGGAWTAYDAVSARVSSDPALAARLHDLMATCPQWWTP